ncbi:hypothetical protein B9Z19DRAFT_1143332 [Tuber borchii]|uniref:Granulins domain-containing protein n=1 Tax=Tuber borchii TaxID=42251 RepID=A0A2T6ZRY9_TUBBO|nr:hypothetical protein B9Z19DRAFT_1143332 [Tuber borchii]
MRFNLVGVFALYVCFYTIGTFATQGPNKAVVGVCQSYSVQKAIFLGGALEARAPVDCGNCPPGQKCCEPRDAALFCVPEGATCCGRTWCSAGFQCCEYGDSNGGCCPIDGNCAVGGRGCCKKGCHNFGSTVCTMREVDPFLCCNQLKLLKAAYPYCRWDPSFGYGCFNSEGDQPVTSSEPTNVSSTPSTRGTGSHSTTTATSISRSGSDVGTNVLSTSERTQKETHSLPTTSSTIVTLPDTSSTTTGANMTTSSKSKRSSSTKGSTTRTRPGTTVAATGTASPSDTSTAIGAGFADLSKGLGWGAIFVCGSGPSETILNYKVKLELAHYFER